MMNDPRQRALERPFPDVRTAFLLTIGALVAGGLVGLLFIDLGLIAAEGLGTAIGIGGVATLAARRVAEPQGPRIGLAPLDWRALPLILCLAPAVLLASELDNFAYDWSPAKVEATAAATATAESGAEGTTEAEAEAASGPEVEPPAKAPPSTSATEARPATAPAPAPAPAPAKAEEPPEPILDPNDPFNLMEALIVSVGIAPVIHEFLFRGVLQQGLIGHLGFSRGLTLTALLWTMLRPVPSTSPARFAAAFVAWFAMGWLLGIVRTATGSILGSILLSSLWAAVGFASIALDGRVAVPGMNVDGTHLPAAVTIASAAVVAWAARRVYDVALRSPAVGASR